VRQPVVGSTHAEREEMMPMTSGPRLRASAIDSSTSSRPTSVNPGVVEFARDPA
jgi:hypothetical protein